MKGKLIDLWMQPPYLLTAPRFRCLVCGWEGNTGDIEILTWIDGPLCPRCDERKNEERKNE